MKKSERSKIMCGIFGILDPKNQLNLKMATRMGYYSMEHRGGSGAGVAYIDDRGEIKALKDMIPDRLFAKDDFKESISSVYIAHARWATAGAKNKRNIQPHFTKGPGFTIAVAANGDVTNYREQCEFLASQNIKVISDNDAEMMCSSIYWQLDRNNAPDVITAIEKSMKHIKGAYSAVLLYSEEKALYAFRDPFGIRPLIIGKWKNRYIVCSETCQLDMLGATFIRIVEPGEIIRIDENGLYSHKTRFYNQYPNCFCCFEDFYFASPDSLRILPNGKTISFYKIRWNLGVAAAREIQIQADMVIPVPQSGIAAALGYAFQSGIPYQQPVLSSTVRTFTENDALLREEMSKKKRRFIPDAIKGKRIIVIDDSCIRLLTAAHVVEALLAAGAREVHFISAAPMVMHLCFYGADIKEQWALPASDLTLEEMRLAINGPTSLNFLSLHAFKRILNRYGGHCFACMDGNYPIL